MSRSKADGGKAHLPMKRRPLDVHLVGSREKMAILRQGRIGSAALKRRRAACADDENGRNVCGYCQRCGFVYDVATRVGR